ncbi:endospore germination permease [Paenibacillus oenotherae]|uniref:endospore germination permease n=1 Tax=Paenibacillus oenotherae TaxID=1435645 RepID=UPI001FE55D50|nr:endospore germination permease [Paenibacillus oenotherae]
MNSKKLGIWSIGMMLMLSVGLANHVFVLPALLVTARRDAWLCIFPALAVLIPWMIVIVHGIMKRTQPARIADWLHHRLPPIVAWIVLIPVMLLLYVHGFQTFADTIAWTSRTYLPKTPIVVISLMLMALVAFAVWSGLRAVVYMSCLLLPPVVLLGDFVMSVNTPDKNYELLLPIMENGFRSLLNGSLYAGGGLIELSFIVFIQHNMKIRMARWQLVLLLFFLALLTLGPTVGALTEFGPEQAAKLRYPAFAQWRLVTVGDYIEHVDFFAIFQWLSGSFVRTSLALIIMMDLLPVRKAGKKLILLLLISLSYVFGTLWLLNHLVLHQSVAVNVFIASIIVITLVILTIWLLSFRRASSGEGESCEREHIPSHP